jgi:hypothetical protein
MAARAYQVERSYVFRVDGVDHPVTARVRRNMHPDSSETEYTYEISHYYRPTKDAATVYYPSRTLASSADEAERFLWDYVAYFTPIDVTANDEY